MAPEAASADLVHRPPGLVAAAEPRPAVLVLDAGRRYALSVLNAGLACCAVEAMVASLGQGRPPGAVPYAGDARSIDVFVVSGTVTDKLAPLVRRLYDALPGPAKVIAFGACASSGGPYWDSYCVTQGIDLVLPVDAYVPGCPPRPQALLDALAALDERGPVPPVRPVDLQRPVVRPPGPSGPSDQRGGPA